MKDAQNHLEGIEEMREIRERIDRRRSQMIIEVLGIKFD